jgi:hypothetical protein
MRARVRAWARVALVMTAVGAVLGSGGAASARTGDRSDDRSKPVLMIHGYNPFDNGADCHLFDPLRNTLVNQGLAIEKWVTVKYHAKDFGCGVDIHGYRKTGLTVSQGHNHHYGTTPTTYKECRHATVNGVANRHLTTTCMEHYGYHFAWMIWEKYTRHGVTVDIVAHSMGGLITRYALGRVEQRHADFPSHLLVEDVVTMGTPHGGTGWSNACGDPTCIASRPNSAFLNMLNSTHRPYFRHPDPAPAGGDRTDWTVMGAWDDGVVDEWSGVAMTIADHRVQYLDSAEYDHDAFYKNTSSSLTADVRWHDAGTTSWTTTLNGRHGARYVDWALLTGTR